MNTDPSTPLSRVDDRRKWMVLATVSTSVLLPTIDGSIVNIAFPTLVEELDTTFNVIQWVALAYLLTIATFILGTGRLGDVVGKKKIYVSGFGVFTGASLLCGLAPSVEWLIAFRVFQGIGAVMVLALGSAILVEAFPDHERGKALGWIVTAVSVGIITGPVLGGILLSAWNWRSIFLVNLPVGIVGTLMAIRFVPETRPVPGQRFDWKGALLMGLSLFSLALALTLGQESGFSSLIALTGFGVSVVAAMAFVLVELRVDSPMIQLRLFTNPGLTVGVVTGIMTFISLSATFLLLPFYLSEVLEMDVLAIGFLLGVTPLMMGIVSPISGTLSDRTGVRTPVVAGLLTLSVVYIAFLSLGLEVSWWHFAMLALPYGIGIGLFQSPTSSAIMGGVPAEYTGLAGGLLHLTRLMGQVVGIAVLGSIWAGRIAAASGGSLPEGGATAASPAAQVAGLHTVFVISALITLAGATIAWFGLRKKRSGLPVSH